MLHHSAVEQYGGNIASGKFFLGLQKAIKNHALLARQAVANVGDNVLVAIHDQNRPNQSVIRELLQYTEFGVLKSYNNPVSLNPG